MRNATSYSPTAVALHLLALSSLTVAQPILSVLGDNPELFIARSSGPVEIVGLTLALILVPPAVLLLVTESIGMLGAAPRRVARMFVMGGLVGQFALQILGGFSIPIAISIGLAVLVGAGFALAYDHWSTLGRYLYYLSFASAVVAIVFLGTGSIARLVFPQQAPESDLPMAESTAPVVFMILDEFPQVSLLNEAGEIDSIRFPNFSRLAEASTWYRNAAATAPYSTKSISGLLSGRWPDPDALPMTIDYPANIFTALRQTHEVHAIEPLTDLCPEDLCREPRNRSIAEFGDLLRISWELYQRLVAPQVLDEAAIALDDPFARRERIDQALAVSRIDTFREFIQGIDDENRHFYFGHFLLPHAPFHHLPSGMSYNQTSQEIQALSPDGKWQGDAWHAFDNHQRHLLQVKALDRLVGELIDHLREIGSFEKTTIVITSDHGVAHIPLQPRRDVTAETLYDVGLVPLFIKAPGQTEGATDNRPIRGIDVMPTLMDLLGAADGWPGDGLSLAGGPGANDLTMTDQDGEMISIDIEGSGRRNAIDRVITRFGAGRSDLYDLFAFGEFSGLVGTPVTENEAGPAILTAEVEDAEEMLAVDANAGPLPAYVAGTITGLDGSDNIPQVGIALNGIIGTVVPLHDVTADRGSFGGVLPESLFQNGTNRLTLFSVLDAGSGPVMNRIASDSYPILRLEYMNGRPRALTDGSDVSYVLQDGAVTGFVDTVVLSDGKAALSGWAINSDTMEPVDLVVAFAGDEMVGIVEPTLPRAALAEELDNDAVLESGFSLSLPQALLPESPQMLQLYGISDGHATELVVIESASKDLESIIREST